MVLPPVLFVGYMVLSLVQLRNLVRVSSSFHLDYANGLIQEYLQLKLEREMLWLEHCQVPGDETCLAQTWFTQTPNETGKLFELEGKWALYLDKERLPNELASFFRSQQGVAQIISRTAFHDPVYWFQIVDQTGHPVFQAYPEPKTWSARASYEMENSLGPYQLDIIYQSFGPKQLYAVAKKKLNFSLIFLFFILFIGSIWFTTHSIRQQLIVARQKSFFVSTVSHEFKTPLAIIGVATETLESGRYRNDEQKSRFFQMIQNELNRMNRLVQKILQFSRMETGQMEVHPRPCDFREVLEKSIEVFRLQAQSEGVELQVELQSVKMPILADPELLRQAIDNIIDNAFKYRGTHPQIQIRLNRQKDRYVLAIQDFGLGMESKEIKNIQKSFYRIPDPQTQGIRGSGLGLSIASAALVHAQGEIQIESEFRKGTTVTISLPINSEQEPEDENHSAS
ncbi:MAG: HAMP domain-containing histidine kinase [Acidobacteria bacterium]|nr:HAMP domain-containing histidine kinase [Acidobacteriota bacterium]MCB9398073.1 HAMP domain-containing histidine kinase [Acidobacteriota bacterium]